MRKDIVNIVNKLAEGCELDFELKKCYELILNYCKEHHAKPSENTYQINNGVLIINNVNVNRVASLVSKIPYDVECYYLEGKILERQDRNFI